MERIQLNGTEKLVNNAHKYWDKFYLKNQNRFFKDRHWVIKEWPELAPNGQKRSLLEVGCGVGNLVFPLLAENPDLFIYAADFSPRAIQFVKTHPDYNESRIKAFVADVTSPEFSSALPVNGVDYCTMTFVISAIIPEKMKAPIRSVFQCLKPGGIVFVRDYAVNDMAQTRFQEKDPATRKLGENYYVRGDGTQVYYFSTEHLERLFGEEGFETLTCEYAEREVTNRKEDCRMNRIFVQARFRKPL